MRNIAIIPARGGSKRIPRKNIKDFLGKPIIAYSIEAAIQSNLFEEIMVSTDDEEIAEVAERFGAKVPFMRSTETANDFASTNDVLKEVIATYEKQNIAFENMCCIYATAPLILSNKIVETYQRLISSEFSMVYPVVPFSYPIWRCLDMDENGTLKRHWSEFENSRSQDLPVEYHDTGTFYWYKIEEWKSGSKNIGGIVVAETAVQDIDNESDWLLAEMKYRLMHGNK
ncbi:MAG: pseudaminic acid cytidylyltransferase [Bacteroidales bacterium]|nr:pseudaminic acid cytidylyltransferase [Bacteroidales bacterium]